MRLSLSKKVFAVFSSLTFITFVLGLIVLAGLNHLRNFHNEILLVNDFKLLVKDLEAMQADLSAGSHPGEETFEPRFKQAENLVREINEFSGKFSPRLRQQLKRAQSHLGNYRQAFLEMLQTYEKDRGFAGREHVLIDSFRDDIRKQPVARQLEFQQLSFRLFSLHEDIYHERNISKLPELEEIYEKIARDFPQRDILRKVREYISDINEIYNNYLTLKEQEQFLTETAATFFTFADAIIEEVSYENDRDEKRLIWIIVGMVMAAAILTLTLWRFSSRYIHNFLGSQRQAIEAIRRGDYDYSVNTTVPDDEIGDLSLFMKQLAASLKDGLKKLRASEGKYRDLVENISDWVWEVDRNGVYTYASPRVQSFLGYEPDEIVGKTLFDFMPPAEAARLRKEFASLIADKRNIVALVNTNIHKNGGQVILETSGIPLLDEQGEFLGYRGVGRNITERLRTEEEKMNLERQLQHVQKLESLGVLAGGIAHDFNNLLMAILGNADLALLEMSPVSPGRQNIIEIEKASRRAAELCRQMLAYSGKGKFVVQKFSLTEVVQEMTHMLEVSISKRAIIKYKFADNLPAIEADPSQIRQVIMNLIINASEAIGDKSGIISITTGAMECDRSYLNETYINEDLPAGTYVYFEVADTGCGMDAATRARLFDPFFTTKFTGRGLGMSAVLGIVRGHHGGIKVYSEPGKGTTFKVLFPAVPGEATRLAGAGEAGEEPLPANGTILLVDDDETVRTVGKQMLEYLGFTVLMAENGSQGLEIFRQRSDEIDCVILDLTMPRMDGEEAFRELRRVRSDVRVILSSGYNEQEVTQRFVGKGLAGFIQKPYTMAPLKKVIREVLATKTARDSSEQKE